MKLQEFNFSIVKCKSGREGWRTPFVVSVHKAIFGCILGCGLLTLIIPSAALPSLRTK